MDDQDSPPPPPTQPPRANAAGAAGGGGGGAARAGEPTDPVWRLFTNTRYGILNADLLMPQWTGQDADAVAQLLERLYKKHHDPTNPQHTGGRLYRALKAGPAVLFAPAQAPPARAAPAPPARAAPVNVRQIAAILSEGRANGYQSPDSDKLPDDPGRRTGPAREPRS